MVINRSVMKRKRKDGCSSPLLDDSPKRTKVHAQRKFAQGSNVNSPVITPVKEIERHEVDVLPEPVELLPIKRPNTEDFLTFLCFRGTPILPPNLNFFNTASIVDTNGQVHEIKSESPKNGPIDTSALSKTGSGPSERPFVAFGVRKRADPIVISRQMDKKRRHALALQALRRKYQEQRMAKIRAVTISKLSEKVTNKTIVRSNSVVKTETVPKKTSTVQKTKVSVVSTKQVKVTTQTVKSALRPQIKQKMCLRSFRGRFVQRELQFRNVKKKAMSMNKINKKQNEKGNKSDDQFEEESDSEIPEYSSEDEEPLVKTPKVAKLSPRVILPKIAKKSAPGPKKPSEINFRITRSNKFVNTKVSIKTSKVATRRQQMKQRLLMSTPTTTVKPRTLRSNSSLKHKLTLSDQNLIVKRPKVLVKTTKESNLQKMPRKSSEEVKKAPKELRKETIPKATSANKSEVAKKVQNTKATVTSTPSSKAKVVKHTVDSKAELKTNDSAKMKQQNLNPDVTSKKNENQTPESQSKKDVSKKVTKAPVSTKKVNAKSENTIQKEANIKKEVKPISNTRDTGKNREKQETPENRTSQRPSRKTKEAAAIYMEILSHKLVNESKIDDDNVSIDSFPELPNVKKTEQRENELKAKAKSTKTNEIVNNFKTKPRDVDTCDSKNLRSGEKRINITSQKKELVSAKKDEKLDVKKKEEAVTLQVFEAQDRVKKVEELKKVLSRATKNDLKEKQAVFEKKAKINTSFEQTEHDTVIDKIKEVELKVRLNPLSVASGNKKNPKIDLKVSESKANKLDKKEAVESKMKKMENSEIESDDSVKTKLKKSESPGKSKSNEIVKRMTRSSAQVMTHIESDDSDESYRIPQKRQNKGSATYQSDSDFSDRSETRSDKKKSLRATSRSYRECTFTESDFSATSDIEVKAVSVVSKNKKLSKTKPKQKNESFSESDEEPLSKLTVNKKQDNKDLVNLDSEKKPSKQSEPSSKKTKEKVEVKTKEKDSFIKPKRECAKRPQNYLPMFSSSDEEDFYFHGFKTKEESLPVKAIKNEPSCSHVPTTSDLSCKDIGRRFGKGKVNMSNEQIEKWLKDSAMAGSSVKSENDAMLKFGEKIPTETLLQVHSCIDTVKLKSLLITALDKDKDEPNVVKKVIDTSPKEDDKIQIKDALKPDKTALDRKLIFRNKDKSTATPIVSAFSASNESSVYAFGDDDEIMKAPFRRPSRRPSSTATSRSEDDSSKFEELSKLGQFRKPPAFKQEPLKHITDSSEVDLEEPNTSFYSSQQSSKSPAAASLSMKSKITSLSQKLEDVRPSPESSMVPPTQTIHKHRDARTTLKQQSRSFDRNTDTSDDYKYKVPSSPSASSSSSAKLYKRHNTKQRLVDIAPVKLSDFPTNSTSHHLVEAPTFYPTDKEFQDPLEYIERIRPKAEQFGICRIVPPTTFKPECKVTDDMRFTAYNQYVHKMLHRWGPNFKELMAIKKYLSTQNINLTHPPWIGGMEVDLPRLYQTVQSLGGLKEVIEKKKWPKVSDLMKIPKSAQDRVTKLDDIYCKYLLPYDTLSPSEREKLFDEVETDWAKRESKSLLKAQQNVENEEEESESETDDEAEECITKGRGMALNAFYRIARNTMSMWFKTPEPPAQEVEQEFWKHVITKLNHICVHSGSIDSGNWGYGFAVSKNSPFARHAWNLKVLTNNSGSVLRSLGPIMGVTVPTLHVGMVFSSCCWYRDPHSLPWIEYLHTGGNKIWYGIPDSTSSAFHEALKKLVPNYCRNKTLWLPSDTVMVPPNLLIENGVSLSRIVQEPGQFIVVFPKVFTSSLSTGYVVSESVYFAPPYWLNKARTVFDDLRISCEPSMFSLDRLLLSIVNDPRSNVDVLKLITPAVTKLCDTEKVKRAKVRDLGISAVEKLPLPEAPNIRKKKKMHGEDGDYECEICRMNLFVSLVSEAEDDAAYCLDHAIEQVEKKNLLINKCKLMYTYDDNELSSLVEKLISTIECKMQKKVPNKYAGMPTLLTK